MLSGAVFSFSPLFASNGMFYAFKQSDALGQGICIILFLASIVVWVVMWEKCCSLNKARKESVEFFDAIMKSRNPLGLREEAKKTKAPSARIYLAACERVDSFHIRQPGGGRRAMTNAELKLMRTAMEQAVEDQILILQEKTMILATAAGLLVAIPSMIGSNIIASKIKDFTVHLDRVVDEIYARFKIEQLDSYWLAENAQADAGQQQ